MTIFIRIYNVITLVKTFFVTIFLTLGNFKFMLFVQYKFELTIFIDEVRWCGIWERIITGQRGKGFLIKVRIDFNTNMLFKRMNLYFS